MSQARIHKNRYKHCLELQDLRLALEKEGYETMSWSDPPGAAYQPHSHGHDEYIVVLSGQIIFCIDETEFPVCPGDALTLPAGTVHSAVNSQNETVKYFICTSA